MNVVTNALSVLILYIEDKSIDFDPSELPGFGQLILILFVSTFFLLGPIGLYDEIVNHLAKNKNLSENKKTNVGCALMLVIYPLSIIIWIYICQYIF